MTRTAAEVEAEVEASRNRLDQNVEALKQKMTPGQMFDEAARMMGGTGQQVASKFAEQAKANPMPLAVMGLGLAWLMASNNRGHGGGGYSETRSFAGEEYGYGYQGGGATSGGGSAMGGLKDKAHDLGERASDAIAGAKDKLSGATSSIGDAGRGAAQHIGDVGRGAAQHLGDAAGMARDKAGQAAQQVQRTFLQTLESEPLLIAGLGLIVGAAIGAALPSTSVEDRAMGDARDRIVDKGKDLAQTGMQKATSAAQNVYGAVKDELQNADGGDLGERLEGAVRSGVQAVRDEAQGQAH